MTLIAHLSDTHITTGPVGAAATDRAREALLRVQAMDPRPDFTVLTGDLVDHGRADEYAVARAVLNQVDLRVHVLPGNHDHAPTLLQHLVDAGYARPADQEPDRCYYRVHYPGLTMLCCDSSLPGHHDGALGDRQLRWLDEQLTEVGSDEVVIAMHHHPVASGIAAMDDIMLADADELAQVLGRHDPVQRILVGHLHRAMTATFAGTVVTSAPSTHRQVHLNLLSAAPGAFVREPPGMLLHQLGQGQSVTHHVPIRHTGPPLGRV